MSDLCQLTPVAPMSTMSGSCKVIPERLYHAADPAVREQIREQGLCIRFDMTGFGAVFLTDSACIPAGKDRDVWSVDVQGLSLDPDWTTGAPADGSLGLRWMSFSDIAANRLSLIEPKPVPAPVITFRESMRGVHHGQKDLTLYLDVDGAYVGHVDYAVLQGGPCIEYIDVPLRRREGFASRLMQELQRRYEDQEIQWGMLTDDGAAFYKALPKRTVVREEVVELQAMLAGLKQKRDNLIEQCDRFFERENPSEAERAEFTQSIQPLNSLHDDIFELERELEDQREVIVLIETACATAAPSGPADPEITPV